MNRTKTNLLTLAFFLFSTIAFCQKKGKDIKEKTFQTVSVCNQTIKYIIEKAQFIKGGNETRIHIEIEVNPVTNSISFHGDDPEKGKVSFDSEIESVECSLNETLTAGQALYKGYIKQDNGTKTWASLLVEAKDGQLLIKDADPNQRGGVIFIVERWEVIEG